MPSIKLTPHRFRFSDPPDELDSSIAVISNLSSFRKKINVKDITQYCIQVVPRNPNILSFGNEQRKGLVFIVLVYFLSGRIVHRKSESKYDRVGGGGCNNSHNGEKSNDYRYIMASIK